MKKLVSIVLSLVVLVQSSAISMEDIVQIDDFIEHAKFHSQEYGDNLIVFISKHYGDLMIEHEKDHQEEKEQHEELPFKQNSNVIASYAFLLQSENLDIKLPLAVQSKEHTYFYKVSLPSCYLEGLFQPPRLS